MNIINILSISIIPTIILTILVHGLIKKVNSYEAFIEGASEGFNIAVKIIPYLVAIMVAVAMFRASGVLGTIQNALSPILETLKIPLDTVIIMLTRSLSGSATLGVLSDIVSTNGADSYASKLASVIVGSSETTFYVLAVYFGSVGIKKMRHAVLVGILADIIGIVVAVAICRIFFL
ncbi:spore maturation protein [bacterium]|nr:spore maturation protein [bacterium]